MATFVVSVDRQSAPTRVDAIGNAPRQELPLAVLLTGVLTLFAVAVNGYHPYAEDGGLYLAGVKRLLDPALYPHSTAFVMEPTRFSLFAPMVASIVRLSHLSLPVTLLALHLTSIWVTLFAAWMLASRCWTTRTARVGAVSLLACWLSLPVAGTALVLMDPYLTARSISTPCMILALVGVLDCTGRNWPATKNSRRWGFYLWIASILLATAMHPLMASYALGATLVLACLRLSDQSIKRRATTALSVAAMVIATCLQYSARPENADYRRIDFVRADLGGRALAETALVTGATAWVIAMLFARVGAPTHLVARMQPLRAFHIVYLVMILFLGAVLGEAVLRTKNSAWRWITVLLVLGGVMLAAGRNAFPNSQHIEFPRTSPRNQWVQAFLWIREHTPRDALFALNADYINAPGEDAQCFRAIAERSSLSDYSKDGGEASIAPELTAQWKIDQQAQRDISASANTDSMRIAALNPLGVSWLVLDNRATTNLICPYANATVKVCRLR